MISSLYLSSCMQQSGFILFSSKSAFIISGECCLIEVCFKSLMKVETSCDFPQSVSSILAEIAQTAGNAVKKRNINKIVEASHVQRVFAKPVSLQSSEAKRRATCWQEIDFNQQKRQITAHCWKLLKISSSCRSFLHSADWRGFASLRARTLAANFFLLPVIFQPRINQSPVVGWTFYC